MRCSRHGAQLMGASGARCRGKACHGVANDAVATTNERRRHGRRALGRQSRAPCCHNANRGAACVQTLSKRAFNAKVPADPRSSAAAHVEVHMRSLSLAAPCTYTMVGYVVRWKWEGQERAARTAGDGRPTPTAAGHSAAVADALEDEGWPGCQGSRASATGYDRALLALSRVLNPTTRATRRHTASMRTFDESLAWPLRTLRSA